jgi:hypothetical protein
MCGRVRLVSDYSEIKIRLKFAPDTLAPNFEADWNKPPHGADARCDPFAGRQTSAQDDEVGPHSPLVERRQATVNALARQLPVAE